MNNTVNDKFEAFFGKDKNAAETKRAQLIHKKIHYSKIVENEEQKLKNADLQIERIDNLADTIYRDGGVLSEVLVAQIDVDTYKCIAGHTRVEACKKLVKEGYEEYAMIPCAVYTDIPDILVSLFAIDSNSYATLTASETRKYAVRIQEILDSDPIRFGHLKGRTAEKIAKIQKRSKSAVAEDIKLAKTASEQVLCAYDSGNISRKTALALATQDKNKQNELLKAGVKSVKEVKEAIGEAPTQPDAASAGRTEDSDNLPGQMTFEISNPDYSAEAAEKQCELEKESLILLIQKNASEDEIRRQKLIITALDFYARSYK